MFYNTKKIRILITLMLTITSINLKAQTNIKHLKNVNGYYIDSLIDMNNYNHKELFKLEIELKENFGISVATLLNDKKLLEQDSPGKFIFDFETKTLLLSKTLSISERVGILIEIKLFCINLQKSKELEQNKKQNIKVYKL